MVVCPRAMRLLPCLSDPSFGPNEGCVYARVAYVKDEQAAAFVVGFENTTSGPVFDTSYSLQMYHKSHKANKTPDILFQNWPKDLVAEYNEVFRIPVRLEGKGQVAAIYGKPTSKTKNRYKRNSDREWTRRGLMKAKILDVPPLLRVAVTPGAPQDFNAELERLGDTYGAPALVGKVPTLGRRGAVMQLARHHKLSAEAAEFLFFSVMGAGRGFPDRVAADPRLGALFAGVSFDASALPRGIVARMPDLLEFLTNAHAAAHVLTMGNKVLPTVSIRHMLIQDAPNMDASVDDDEILHVLVRPDACVQAYRGEVRLCDAPPGVALAGKCMILVSGGASKFGTGGGQVFDRDLDQKLVMRWAEFALPIYSKANVQPLTSHLDRATVPLSFSQRFTNKLGGVYALASDKWTDGDLRCLRAMSYNLIFLHEADGDAFKARLAALKL